MEKKRWSKKEDSILIEKIAKNPANLHRCFLVVAEEINRTPSAVRQRWYTIRKKSPAFITSGKNKYVINIKNMPLNTSFKYIKRTFWSRLKNILKI